MVWSLPLLLALKGCVASFRATRPVQRALQLCPGSASSIKGLADRVLLAKLPDKSTLKSRCMPSTAEIELSVAAVKGDVLDNEMPPLKGAAELVLPLSAMPKLPTGCVALSKSNKPWPMTSAV